MRIFSKLKIKKIVRTYKKRIGVLFGVILLCVFAIVFWNDLAVFLGIRSAQASTYQMQTGYYVGDGGSKEISGLGFAPEVVILKADTVGGTGAIMKTTAMPQNNVAYLGVGTADDIAGQIQLTNNGFVITGALSNTANNRYTWVAFSGSDCSAGGQLCVGSYTGDGLATKVVATGFNPDLVVLKQSTGVPANWRTTTMPTNYAQFFTATAQDTTGVYFTSLNATSFTVGATNNIAGTFYYVAFKEVAGAIDVGSYVGDTSDNRSITNVGFRPDWLFVKNANVASSSVYSLNESFGDFSSYFTDTANLVNAVQALEDDGFQVGTSITANGSTNTHYYAAFGGALAHTSSGTFASVSGTYTGDGNARTISNLGFTPDLVIIKASTTQQSVFSTRMMGGDSTAYLGSATANFAGGITTFSPNGFTVGSNATVNGNGVIYVWTAYGNAWNPETHTGASDFTIGAYSGNATDTRTIVRIPFQPDMVTIKQNAATLGVWRSSEHIGDLTSYFSATADATNRVQSVRSDGFEIGSDAQVNTSAGLHWFFAFATGTNFSVGTYSGTGVAKNVGTSFEPDHVWVKQTGAVQGVLRTASTTGATSFPFINTALVSTAITGLYANGFSVGTGAEANTLGVNNYRYAVWADTNTQGIATYVMQTGYFVGNGGAMDITGLGFTPDLVIIKADTTAGVGAIWKSTAMPQNTTAYLGTATLDSVTGLVKLLQDGFRVSGTTGSNDVNVRFTWIAFGGSDCSATGAFCVGRYTGDGAATKIITSGFQPNLVWVKQSTTVLPTWRSSTMPVNYAQYFSATAQDTAGAFFTTLNANGFTVGTTNNANTGVYYYATFKEAAGSIDVGSYLGNNTVDRSIAGVGFTPDWMFTKNAGANIGAVYNVNESYGDYSSYFLDNANFVDAIQALETDGFQVGGSNTAHANGVTYYYAAFGGTPDHTGMGTFQMNSGSYVGTGNPLIFKDLGFKPDLVVIKGNTGQPGVFRTRVMGGDSTAYLDSAAANIPGGITTLQHDSFTVGTNIAVNASGVTYYWTAYGNAWDPNTNTGAKDFVIGALYGNGIDSRNITRLPFQPDMVTLKRNGLTGGAWRSFAHSGDISSFFTASIDAVNNIQSLRADGFQVGTAANVNAVANLYWYFGFASSSSFKVGTYSGNGTSQNITVGFQPNHLWVKRTTATQGVLRGGGMSGDGALPFINNALVSGAITGLTSTGFSVGAAAETNTAGANNYRYVAWKKSVLQQMQYHWRDDDGDEATASSLTGGVANTPLASVREGVPYRVRVEVSNEGGSVASSSGFRLEYGERVTTCGAVASWTRVGDTAGAWDMYNSPNLTNGNNTTNIAVATGGVIDENTTFLTPNGGVRDTSDETGFVTVGGTQFLELEYAVTPTQYATDTATYCFRITAQGEPISEYPVYPEATFTTHMIATTTGVQVSDITIPNTNSYVGGTFVLKDTNGGGIHTLTDITLTETGTVNGMTGLDNIKLFYEFATSAPYDCADETYDGTEAQFGVTDTDGFSNTDGVASFAGSLSASTTQTVCLYPVMDVTANALSGDTIELQITTASDITFGGGDVVRLLENPLMLSGTTILSAPLITQSHYHWRLDNGGEADASSATGGTEDTVLNNLSKSTPIRIRLEVSNEGLATSSATVFRLEFAERSGSCAATASGWADVAGAGGAWDMYNSTNLTEGNNTTNVDEATGGVTDENTVFLTPNGGVRDTSSETGALTLEPDEFTEFEYSVTALSGASAGMNYCFRVIANGSPLQAYSTFPEVSIASDVMVSALGSHISTVRAGTNNFYNGGAWAIVDQSSSRNVTSITLKESGTIDAQANLSLVRLRYEYDTSSPYNCASESYNGTEEQYGDITAFSSADGTATFSETVGIATTSTLCLYTVMDVDALAGNGETIQLEMSDPSLNVVVSSGTINPKNVIGPTGSTTIQKAHTVLEHYHFRNDDGSEALATSKTNGVQDVSINGAQSGVPVRLRLEVNNAGSTSTLPSSFELQYTERVTTCSAADEGAWTKVGGSGAVWSPSESSYLTAGDNTINIANAIGGVTDENNFFVTPNYGVIERSATTSMLALDTDEFVEIEYVIEPNTDAVYGTTYCFRVVENATPLVAYDVYPEAMMGNNQDFYIQRGVSDIANGASTVSITAGVEYTAPSASTSAFIRISNAANTGAGATSGGGTQNASNVTTSILNPSDITTGVTFVRTGVTNSTRIYWEIVEYIGPAGGDNEIRVRQQQRVTYGAANLTASTPASSGIVNDTDVVVFITGQQNPSANSTAYHQGISTAVWNSGSDTATFTRGVSGVATIVSYAVVEFTGSNWKIQRSEHVYSAAGSTQYENITPVNDKARAFLHTQKRVGSNQVDDFGHEVWLSSVGQISYLVPSTAGTIASHVSVAWVIENTQTNGNPMVVTQSSATQGLGGTEPGVYSISIGATLSSLSNGSLFLNLSGLGNSTAHPQAIMGGGITSTTNYELWISDTGSGRSYRSEVVNWPTAVLTVSQEYFRFYVNDDALDPTDPWPAGAVDLGENTTITGLDLPPSTGDTIRIRMSLKVGGASISQGSKQYKLQYGTRNTSCSAISTWLDVGDTASTTALWRGYNATPLDGSALSVNPPTLGDLNLSVSDRAGTFEEVNPTEPNPYKIYIGDDVEYDWLVQANGVVDFTSYCFRMVEADTTELQFYTYYPTITIAGFQVEQQAWRWYDDETSLTPSVALAATNTAPSNFPQAGALKLRVLLEEQAGKDGANTKYKLQWSEFSNFSVVQDVADRDTCASGSRWCYFDGAGTEGATITASVLYNLNTCVAGVGYGCGTHNEYSYAPDVVGEVGTTTTDAGGTTIVLRHTYDDPVFIVEAISGDATGGAGNRPAAAVITATTTSSFTLRIQEPDDESDTHGVETISYIVMERGSYLLPDGRRVDVNTITTNRYYGNAVTGASDDTCVFNQTFTSVPVILTSLQTNNNTGTPDFLTASIALVSSNDFACSIEVPDGETNEPTQPETIGWIAIEGGMFTNNGINFEATTTSTSITGWADTPWYEQIFTQSFMGIPGIIAKKQTRNGAEGGWVRYDNEDFNSVLFAIDERDNGERNHTNEVVAYLAHSVGGVLYRSGSSDFVFTGTKKKEFEFTLQHHDAHNNVTYFFRLYDVQRDTAVTATTTTNYPSISTEGATLSFSIDGVNSGVATEGVTTDITSTATSVPFGSLSLGVPKNAAQRLTVTTNASEGYQILAYERQNLISGGGTIEDIAGTNIAPVSWASGCLLSATSCYGYHVGDNTLTGGSTRFLLPDTFAALTGTLSEIAYSSGPVRNESTDIIYRVKVNAGQSAGQYESKIVYIVVPVF